jgi:hypothetical protein
MGETSLYVDSVAAQYAGYQQAWRLLGFYVDCDAYNGCKRYLMWAAYVDLQYTGEGIGSYSFYEPSSKSYNSSLTCSQTAPTRCAKLDCHDVSKTHWKLLGVFKQEYFSSKWFYQLFQHEGSCVWDNGYTTDFMEAYFASWPEGCVATKYKSSSGRQLYISLKPSYGAYMALSLYSDSYCKTEYDESDASEKLKLAASDNSYLYGATLETWNKNMNSFKYCQPCVSYNLAPYSEYHYSTQGAYYGNYGCKDAGGAISVNQCMKFRYNTDMQAATLRDLDLADQQGGILQISVGGRTYGTPISTINLKGEYQNLPNYRRSSSKSRSHTAQDAFPFLVFSVFIFVAGVSSLGFMIRWKSQRETARGRQLTLKEPLMTEKA